MQLIALLASVQTIARKGDLVMEAYFRDVSRCKFLSVQEEVELWRELNKGSIKARNLLIQGILPLIVKMAVKHKGRLPLEDAIQEANLKVLEVLNSGKYDPTISRLSTYVSKPIFWRLRRASDIYSIIRISPTAYKDDNLPLKTRRLVNSHGDPTITLVVGVTDEQIEPDWILPFITKEGLSFGPEDEGLTREELIKALGKIPKRERFVVKQYYYKKRTLDSIGQEMKITKERVRQIRNKGEYYLKRFLEKALTK